MSRVRSRVGAISLGLSSPVWIAYAADWSDGSLPALGKLAFVGLAAVVIGAASLMWRHPEGRFESGRSRALVGAALGVAVLAAALGTLTVGIILFMPESWGAPTTRLEQIMAAVFSLGGLCGALGASLAGAWLEWP